MVVWTFYEDGLMEWIKILEFEFWLIGMSKWALGSEWDLHVLGRKEKGY